MSEPDLSLAFWHLITRLGETGVVLAVALVVLVWLWRRARSAAVGWAMLLGCAVLLVTATKVAFFGFGQGIAALDFTGLSGHSMFAGAAYPLLGWAAMARGKRWLRWGGLAGGTALAVLVAISRVPVQAHSVSEVIGGGLVGLLAAAGGVLLARRHPPARPLSARSLGLLAVWTALLVGVMEQPLVPSHGMVVRLSLAVSGREHPYTRADLHKKKPPLHGATGVEHWRCSGQALLPT